MSKSLASCQKDSSIYECRASHACSVTGYVQINLNTCVAGLHDWLTNLQTEVCLDVAEVHVGACYRPSDITADKAKSEGC